MQGTRFSALIDLLVVSPSKSTETRPAAALRPASVTVPDLPFQATVFSPPAVTRLPCWKDPAALAMMMMTDGERAELGAGKME